MPPIGSSDGTNEDIPDAGTRMVETAFSAVLRLFEFAGIFYVLKRFGGNKAVLYALTALHLLTRATARPEDDVFADKVRDALGVTSNDINEVLMLIGALKTTAAPSQPTDPVSAYDPYAPKEG